MEKDAKIPMTQEEMDAEEQKTFAEAVVQKNTMQQLLEFAPFQYLMKALQQQVDQRIYNELLVQPQSADEVVQRTYCAGEIAGIKIALDYPNILISYAQASIDYSNKKQENRDAERDSGEGTPGQEFDLDDEFGNFRG